MTRSKLWGLLTAFGFIFILFGIGSDLLRGRPFYLGWTQSGLLVVGSILIITSLYLRFQFKFRWFNSKFVPFIIFLVLVIFSSTLIGYLKIDSFNSWRYTSDLFTFHTVVQETAKGNVGLEFTWGNIFGEHGYLFFFLLVPFQWFFKSDTIFVLLLSGPVFYGISSIIFFLTIRRFLGPWMTLFSSAIYLFGFSYMYRGLFEDRYGMHPDTYSGYLAAIMALLLIWKDHNDSQNKDSNPQKIGVIISLSLFLTLKQEMALLAIIYFVIVLIFRKSNFNKILLIASIVVFGIDLILIRAFHSPFNRALNSHGQVVINGIKESGLRFLFPDINGAVSHYLIYFLVIIVLFILFVVTIRSTRKLNPYTISLFTIGLLKILFSLSVMDFSLTTWHNFPGLIMMITGIFLHLLVHEKQSMLTQKLILLLVVTSTICFLSLDIPFVREQLLINTKRKPLISELTSELTELKELIQPLRVVAIPKYSERAWVNYRYSLYPRGIYWSPVGIADYLVYPYNDARKLTAEYSIFPLPNSFTEVSRTDNYGLFKRTSLTEEEKINREYFSKHGLNFSIVETVND